MHTDLLILFYFHRLHHHSLLPINQYHYPDLELPRHKNQKDKLLKDDTRLPNVYKFDSEDFYQVTFMLKSFPDYLYDNNASHLLLKKDF